MWCQMHFKVMIFLHLPQSNDFVHIWHQKHFKVMISLALPANNEFVHIWCQTHFKVTISRAFAFKVMILYICSVKPILK